MKNQTFCDLHNISAIPPGLSETTTVNLQILPSAIKPRSMTLVKVDASILPPHKTVATLKYDLGYGFRVNVSGLTFCL